MREEEVMNRGKKKLLWLFIQVYRGSSSSIMQRKKKTALASCSSMQRPIIFNYETK
jgi:hypothetical protein